VDEEGSCHQPGIHEVQVIDSLLENNVLPDSWIRFGIRRLLRERLREEKKPTCELQQDHFMGLVQKLKTSPIAVHTGDANKQHYEVPTEFFTMVLGKHMKYSAGYWRKGVQSLDQSEEDMLALTCDRAELSDGMKILELGCGWGSLTLFMAERFPHARITSVSNSRSQKTHIEHEVQNRGLKNVRILTADMNTFSTREKFDRVVSVEMFEHMRNYESLMARIAGWLRPAGKLFVHIFTHKEFAYPFEVRDESDWMSKYFFTGGLMPSDHLLLYFTKHFDVENHWRASGKHYARTSEAWLRNMDANKARILPILESTYGTTESKKWWVYWRVFFMACAELWGYRNGEEWFVSHYLFTKR
jgi:cyclopropane-fatty-acyl-phospholipid synthase